MGGGSAPKVPQEEQNLLATQNKIAKEEWGLKLLLLQEEESWATGGQIPSYLIPDFSGLMKSAGDIATTEKANVASDYAPVQAAINTYYGPAMTLPETETIKKEAATQKEATAGYAGLPSQTAQQMENIATWQAGSIVDVQRTADIAKAGANVALAYQIGSTNANIDQALAQFDLQTTQQQTMFEPTLRANAVSGMTSGTFINPEAQYATATQGYMNEYNQELNQYGINQASQMSWINTFANLGQSLGSAASDISSIPGIAAAV